MNPIFKYSVYALCIGFQFPGIILTGFWGSYLGLGFIIGIIYMNILEDLFKAQEKRFKEELGKIYER